MESYKLDCISSANECPGNFWELSDAVLSHIDGDNYTDNKSSQNELLKKNYSKKSLCGKKKIYQHALSTFISIPCTLLLFNKSFFIVIVFKYIYYVFNCY